MSYLRRLSTRSLIVFLTLVVVFTLGVLFSVVAVTPQGLGMVEVTLLGAFTMGGYRWGGLRSWCWRTADLPSGPRCWWDLAP